MSAEDENIFAKPSVISQPGHVHGKTKQDRHKLKIVRQKGAMRNTIKVDKTKRWTQQRTRMNTKKGQQEKRRWRRETKGDKQGDKKKKPETVTKRPGKLGDERQIGGK